MKTINGKNKLERQINRAKKYLGIDLEVESNRYLRVKKQEYENNIFVISPSACRYSKNCDWLLIDPINWPLTKPIIIKPFKSIWINNFRNPPIVIFQVNFDYLSENEKQALEHCLNGYDDIFSLNYWLTTQNIYIKKL
ncbi:hypothetical protein [Mycoplasma enhydrae]|uniref:hypothetical protein n=1 Tax=Mycoplasma enhydrae TaxID=2499220 RepID=UPI00197C20D7|nr:hypothetical protein [Mycoplasma enhydrae]MBN4089702.1 hypothetical protein [Mycoplasma enhydrae]